MTGPPPTIPRAPPTSPGPIVPIRRRGWHRVIGIGTVLLGGLVILSAVYLGLVFLMTGWFMPVQPGMAWLLADLAASLALGALAVSAGAGLLAKRRWSVRAAMVWAIIQPVWSVAVAFMGWQIAVEHPGIQASYWMNYQIAAAAFWSLPALFVLIWFALHRTRRAVAAWT